MKVAELQQFVRSLVVPLTAAGGKKAADDLERVGLGLQAFAELSIPEFVDFLAQAEQYKREGILPAKGSSGGKRSTTDATKVQHAAQRAMELYEKAADPELQYTTIDSEIKKLEKYLTKEEAAAVALQVGISGKPRTKKAAMDQIKLMITTRKESLERSQFRAHELESGVGQKDASQAPFSGTPASAPTP